MVFVWWGRERSSWLNSPGESLVDLRLGFWSTVGELTAGWRLRCSSLVNLVLNILYAGHGWCVMSLEKFGKHVLTSDFKSRRHESEFLPCIPVLYFTSLFNLTHFLVFISDRRLRYFIILISSLLSPSYPLFWHYICTPLCIGKYNCKLIFLRVRTWRNIGVLCTLYLTFKLSLECGTKWRKYSTRHDLFENFTASKCNSHYLPWGPALTLTGNVVLIG